MGRLPSTPRALEKAYRGCQKRFRIVDKQQYHDYVIRSQKDLASAENDFDNGDYYWVRIKAYQALFHILNALLVKHLGYYSKDHGCILTALLKSKIISDETSSKLHLVAGISHKNTFQDTIQDIDDFRIQRNFALYKPKAWEEVTKENIQSELQKIKKNIKVLLDLL